MKKILLVSALTLNVVQNSFAASNYNGWAAGASAGYTSASLKLKFLDDKNGTNANNLGVKTKATKNSAIFGLHIDWHKSMPSRLYFGFGMGLGVCPGTSKTILYDATPTGATATKMVLKYSNSFYGDLTARLGMNLNDSIVYALFTLRSNKVKGEFVATSSTSNYNYVAKDSSVDNSLGSGLGFDKKISDRISIGLEYRYLVREALTLIDDDKTNFAKVKNKSHNLGLRISYHF